MRVDVFDQHGQLVETYDISLRAYNYTPSEAELIEEVRKNAVEDELADIHDLEKFVFKIRAQEK
jgi:hypothetical protein